MQESSKGENMNINETLAAAESVADMLASSDTICAESRETKATGQTMQNLIRAFNSMAEANERNANKMNLSHEALKESYMQMRSQSVTREIQKSVDLMADQSASNEVHAQQMQSFYSIIDQRMNKIDERHVDIEQTNKFYFIACIAFGFVAGLGIAALVV